MIDTLYTQAHDDVIKWWHFPRSWPFVRGIHRSPVNSPHKGQWRGALMFSLICIWINGWVNNREAGDLRRYRAHYDVTVMMFRRGGNRSPSFVMWKINSNILVMRWSIWYAHIGLRHHVDCRCFGVKYAPIHQQTPRWLDCEYAVTGTILCNIVSG